MTAHANTSEQLTAPDHDGAPVGWVPSSPVLEEVAQRVRRRLKAETKVPRHVFVGHTASIPDDA